MALLDTLRSFKEQAKEFLYGESRALAGKLESFLVPSSSAQFAIFSADSSESNISSSDTESLEESAAATAVRRNFRALRDLAKKATTAFLGVWKSAGKSFITFLNETSFFVASATKALLWTASALISLRMLAVYPFTVVVGGGLMYAFGDKKRAKRIVQNATTNLANEINLLSALSAVGFLISLTPLAPSSFVLGTLLSTAGLAVLSVGALGATIWHDQIKDRLFKPTASITASSVTGMSDTNAGRELEHESGQTAQLDSGGPVISSSENTITVADTQATLDANKRMVRFLGGVAAVTFSPNPVSAAFGAAVAEEALNKYREPRASARPAVRVE